MASGACATLVSTLSLTIREVLLTLIILVLSITWKDIGLFVSITHPSNLKDRSIGVKEQCFHILNKRSSFPPCPLLP